MTTLVLCPNCNMALQDSDTMCRCGHILVVDNLTQPVVKDDGSGPPGRYVSFGDLADASGVAVVGDGGTIAHGLGATPTYVSLVGSIVGELVYPTALNTTNITVAIKTAAGAAGTSQRVTWEAVDYLTGAA